MEGLRGNLVNFLENLKEANPSDCKRLFKSLTAIVEKEGNLSPVACLVLDIQEILLVFGLMKEEPFTNELKRGEFERMTLNMKTVKTPAGKRYSLCGRDMKDEIATFDGLFQAALVARYLSGGSMEKQDMKLALAAIAEYDEGSCEE